MRILVKFKGEPKAVLEKLQELYVELRRTSENLKISGERMGKDNQAHLLAVI